MSAREFNLEDSFNRAMAGQSSLGELVITGNLLMKQRDYGRSELMFRQVLRHYPYDMSATFMVGLMLLKQGRADEAENFFRDIVQDNQDDAENRVYLARSMIEQFRDEDAIEQFWTAMTLNPMHGDIYFRLSEMFEQRGEMGHAVFYSQVFEICARKSNDSEEREFAAARLEHLRQVLKAQEPPPSWQAFDA